MPLALALDLGTTSIAAAAVSADGSLVAHVQEPNNSAIGGLPAGYAEQDPLRIAQIACDVLHRLADVLPETPRCLGITGQMHGGLVLDSNRRPLTNLITWQDRRANQLDPQGTGTYLDSILRNCPEPALYSAGSRPAAGFLGPTLFVLRRDGNPSLERAARVSSLADWISAELRDGPIAIDPSNAQSLGVFDLEHRTWSDELLAACHVPRSWMPDIGESGAVLGGISAKIARRTGLPVGLPVCNAIGDNQAAVLGSVPAGQPAIQINVGTGGQINWPVPKFTRLPGMETRYLPVGRLMLVGPGLSGGDAYAWVNRTAAKWLAAFGVELSTDAIYARMNELAADLGEGDIPDCDPLFRGSRWKPSARGEFHGVTFDNFSLGHVAQSVLRGIAQGMYTFYAAAGDGAPAHLDRIIGSGNGLRKNPLLVREISRRFARPVWFPAHTQEAAYGAALLSGASTGLWRDLETAGRDIRLVPAQS